MAELIERNVIKTMVADYNEEIENLKIDVELFETMSGVSLKYALKGKVISEPYGDRKVFNLNDVMNIDNLIIEAKKTFWEKAINLSGVKSVMPRKRLDEWNEVIEKGKDLPDFTVDIVRDTLFDFFSNTRKYMGEKVDGILKNLSPSHKTNIHDQITERFIFSNMVNTKFDTVNYSMAGLIDDLRTLIKQIQGVLTYENRDSSRIIDFLYKNKTGEWCYVDGNAFRIRVYKKGTAHVELNPSIVESMCELLSEVYPMQIANKDRIIKIKKEFRDFELKKELISGEVCRSLVGRIYQQRNVFNRNYGMFSYGSIENREEKEKEFSELLEKHLFNYSFDTKVNPEYQEEFDELLKFHGIKKMNYQHYDWYAANYDFQTLLTSIGIAGYHDDYVSHQYYPTNEKLAKELVKMADFKTNEEKTLEPSAGQGGIAQFIPSSKLTCVEISKINSDILMKKGFSNVINVDFLKFVKKETKRYERILMNPPFSKGRAKEHVKSAFSLLDDDGILVAIMPSSFKNKEIVEGKKHEFSEVFEDEFDNAKVNVVMVKIFN